MSEEYVLKEYYVKYLENVRSLSDSSVRHYLDAINWVSKYLRNKQMISDTLYEVLDINSLEYLYQILLSDPEFVAMNKRGHQMYTAGINNYLRFARGDDFERIGLQLSIMDEPIQVPKLIAGNIKTRWRRSEIIKQQSLRSAHYLCEVNNKHITFMMKNEDHAYMEGHHSIPMSLQGSFGTSLDVYANIVCLCPTCHRLLHYGRESDKKPVLDKIYYDRSARLAHSGIKMSHEEFIKVASL